MDVASIQPQGAWRAEAGEHCMYIAGVRIFWNAQHQGCSSVRCRNLKVCLYVLVPAMVETKMDSRVQAWVVRPAGTGTRKRRARPMAQLANRGTSLMPGQGFGGVLAASAGSPAATAADACTCKILMTAQAYWIPICTCGSSSKGTLQTLRQGSCEI